MRRSIPVLLFALTSHLVFAQQPAEKPASTGLQETVKVTLLQIDVLALDGQGKTVPDLKAEDFTMKLGDTPLKVSTVDVTCPIGATDDPVPLKDGATAPPAPIAPGIKRRVVFAFDYSFLDHHDAARRCSTRRPPCCGCRRPRTKRS